MQAGKHRPTAAVRNSPASGDRVRDSRGTAQAGVRPGLPLVAASALRHLMQERGGGSVPSEAAQPMATYLQGDMGQEQSFTFPLQ